MTTMEKPHSKKAKSFNRHNGKQDHGNAASRKGRLDIGSWERRYNERGATRTDKTYLKEVIRDGLSSDPTPDELNFAKNSEKVEAESQQIVEDIENYHTYEDVDYDEGENDDQAYLDSLYEQAASIVKALNKLPRTADGEYTSQSELDRIKDELEGDLESIKEEINTYEGTPPSISEYEHKTEKEIKKAMAKRATLDYSYTENDDGDNDFDSHVRIKNSPR